MSNETPNTTVLPVQSANATVIVHDSHEQAEEIFAAILQGLPAILEGIELVAPVVFNLVNSSGHQQITINPKPQAQ